MGRYIDDILQPGEKVLYSSNLHWVVYTPAILAWIVSCTLLVLSRTTLNENLILLYLASAAVVALAALYWTLSAWFRRWITETDVTNLRVVHKTGFITRKTFEISIDKVASVEVNQSIMGRILNYGDVTIENMGDDNQVIKMIASPLAFRSNITAR
ncbi:MAG: PH domain-containing protein [Tardiphaga sp.]